MTIREAAQQYIDRGWHVVPLHPHSKKCIDEDWRTRTYKADDFEEHQNIGIKSVGGLVDIDCDCAEAVAMCEAFLPRTRAIYGRKSRPRSHWLFRCADLKDPLTFKDLIAKKNLLEVRVNHQTMAPPSTHPEGEQVEWDTESIEEMVADKALLVRTVQLISTACMVARYYNPPGARHDWGIALAGFFRRLGINQAEADRIFQTAGRWANDTDIKDRTDGVRTTYSVSEDTPTTGAKRLEELIGDQGPDFVKSIYKIWGDSGGGVSKSRLEEMNKKHAVIHLQGGSVMILTEEMEDGRLQLRFSNRADLNLLYPQKVQTGVTDAGRPIYRPLGEAWIDHPKRRFYRGLELAPNGKCNEGYYNLWQGFTVEPKQGDWSLFKQHISLLSRDDPAWTNYIISWMAETVQHPERPIGIALAFKGGQGVGKSTFGKWYGELFGAHFLHLDSEHRLLGQFNAHLQNTIVVLADEAVWAGGKQGLGALKRMVTESTLAIERKGVDVINAKNMLHMIIASNEDWFVPTGFDNRRFAIFEVSEARQNQYKFFGAVAEQLFEKGGLAALLYDLLNFKVTINLRDIPDTDELKRQKQHSMTSRQAWWYEQLQSGAPWQSAELLPPDGEGEVCYQIDPEMFYSAYVTSLRMADHRINAGTAGAVGRFLRTMLPEGFPQVTQQQGKRYWILPSLERSRKHFDRTTRMRNKWPVDPDMRLDPEVPF